MAAHAVVIAVALAAFGIGWYVALESIVIRGTRDDAEEW
jgi:hypothetical protein